MAYTISRWALTQGGFPFTLANDTTDTTHTPLTLSGQGVVNYGMFTAENFLYLLENFAGASAPLPALSGSLWFDTSVYPGVLRVRDLSGTWTELAGQPPLPPPIVVISPTPPSNPQIGEAWLNTSVIPPVLSVWNGSSWLAIANSYTPGSFTTLTDGPGIIVQNGLVYGNTASTLNFITPPSIANTYLTWNGSSFVWSAPLFKSLGDVASPIVDKSVLIGLNPGNVLGHGTIAFSQGAPLLGWNFLRFDGSNFIWADPFANRGLDDLSDVQFGGPPLNNQVLQFNGAIWTNAPLKFIQLADTPNNIVASGVVVGNAGGTALTYAPTPTNNTLLAFNAGVFSWVPNTLDVPPTFVELSDGPGVITPNGVVVGNSTGTEIIMVSPGSAGQVLAWNGTTFIWVTQVADFQDLGNVPATITTNGLVTGNNTGSGLTYVAPPGTPNQYLEWNGAQYIWNNAIPANGSITQAMLAPGVGVNEFTELLDCPATIESNGIVVGNSAGTDLVFITTPLTPNTFLQWTGSTFAWNALVPGGGTVTNVAVVAGSSKVFVSGSPITSAGVITVDVNEGNLLLQTLGGSLELTSQVIGVLPTDNGGTGLSSFTGDAIFYATNSNTVGQISPTGADTFLQWTGSGYQWVTGGSGSVTSVELASPNSTLAVSGANPITTSGTIDLDISFPIEAPIGSSGAPTYSFAGATNTGIFANGTGNVTIQATASVTLAGSVINNVRIITAPSPATANLDDYLIVIKQTVGAPITVNLPASPPTGLTYKIKDGKGDAGTNNITIAPQTGTIDGAATFVMNTNYQSNDVIFNGVEWSLV